VINTCPAPTIRAGSSGIDAGSSGIDAGSSGIDAFLPSSLWDHPIPG